jgi:uncharacterized protein (TIGR03435 family)
VDAKAFRTMLQSLLAQRFALKLHRESKEISGYELVVAKNGPHFHESAAVGVASGGIGPAARERNCSASRGGRNPRIAGVDARKGHWWIV